jgi:hypothetical protein
MPTIFPLLVPDERPATFTKSRLDYDKKLLGFAWKTDSVSPQAAGHSYLFDTQRFPAFNNIGHDTDVQENGKTYKLDWSNDKAGAWALIEYLKTL